MLTEGYFSIVSNLQLKNLFKSEVKSFFLVRKDIQTAKRKW